jgi:hypothetical protein
VPINDLSFYPNAFTSFPSTVFRVMPHQENSFLLAAQSDFATLDGRLVMTHQPKFLNTETCVILVMLLSEEVCSS